MKSKITHYLKKHEQIIRYVIVGGLTTVVSLLSYFALTATLLDPEDPRELQVANIISWILSVIFAFFTNKKYVFKSKEKNITKQMAEFFLSRASTLLMDMLIMFILVTIVGLNDGISKLIVQFVVLILNYILSKFFVFSKSKKQGNRADKIYSLLQKIITDKYFLSATVICLILYGVFMRINYAPDTYWDIMNDGYYVANNAFLPSGRFITAILAIIFKNLNMSPAAVYAISYLSAILFAALSIYLLKAYILDKLIKRESLSFILSVAIIVNPLSIELFIFYEKGVMLLSVLFSVLAAIKFGIYSRSKDKRALAASLLLAFLATCCYQGTLGLYITLMSLINISASKKMSLFIKNSIISVCLYIIAPVFNIILTKIVSVGGRAGGDIRLLDSLMILSQNFKNLIRMFGIIPIKYVYVIAALVIVVSSIWIIIKQKKSIKEMLFVYIKMGFIIAVVLMASFAPYLAQNTDSIWVAPRSAYVFGGIIGIVTCVYYASISNVNYKKIYQLPFIYCVLILVMQFYSFNSIGVNNYIVSNMDKQRALKTVSVIHNYEETTKTKIEKIAVYYDKEPIMTYDGLSAHGDINMSSFSILWANVNLINYWTDSHYEQVFSIQYASTCEEEDNNPSDGDSLHFENNTAIICLY